MNISLIEQGVKQCLLNMDPDRFIFDLLAAYGASKPAIARLMSDGTSSYNLARQEGMVLWKSKVCFVRAEPGQAMSAVLAMKLFPKVAKHKPRFLVATDFDRVAAFDTKLGQPLDIPLFELPNRFDFFLPWAGMEVARAPQDNPADVKAAEKMARLYDTIAADDPPDTKEKAHSLNVFLSRLLFCFFAEDTDIFPGKLFCRSVEAHTDRSGEGLAEYLDELFLALDTEDRESSPPYFREFPYVNGSLFTIKHPAPKLGARARRLLIECGADLNWSEINPDIFGSMIQAVVDVEQRGSMGMHYTSVDNIMKVLGPLFLDEWKEQLEGARGSERKLLELVVRFSQVRIFDPACGSGNFLIIAYKELRKLEMEAFSALRDVAGQDNLALSGIRLEQFYGIELDDFAHEVAILSLWLAEHQMNQAFRAKFGRAPAPLPLRPSGNIVRDNALEVDWAEVCAPNGGQVFLIGNPPYLGARNQDEAQKAELRSVFDAHPDYKDSDYVAGWILKAAAYVAGTSATFAFVTTSSVCQGEQVSYIWPRVLALGLEIAFAHQPFKWSNRAKKNAGVTCVVVGVRNRANKPKHIFNEATQSTVPNISPYLIPGSDTCVARTSDVASGLPRMMIGSMPRGKDLMMSLEKRDEILLAYPESRPLLKLLTGTDEFLTGQFRACLWIEDHQLDLAMSIPPIRERIESVRRFREASKAKTTNIYARTPHKFAQRCYAERASIVVPSTTSERREYVPLGYLEPGVVITNSANAIYEASSFLFGLLSSKIHMVWVRSIGGQLDSRLRYSAEICYNTFPVPNFSAAQRRAIETAGLAVLDRREQYPDMAIEDLYDPDTMPEDLRTAHANLDSAVDRVYRPRPFASDEERLELLLALYEESLEPAHA